MSLPLAQNGPSRFYSLFFLALFAATQFSFSQSNDSEIRINNFGKINDQYYRGAQPNPADFLDLQKMGIRTVIDLQKDGIFQEASWVKNAGMRFYRIPLSSTKPATEEQTRYFLQLVNDPTNWPVYVHCAGGRHRTGAMTAIYRITNDSWTPDRAFDEMQKFGWYSFPNHGSLKKYVYRYFQDNRSTVNKKSVLFTAPDAAPNPPPLPSMNAN